MANEALTLCRLCPPNHRRKLYNAKYKKFLRSSTGSLVQPINDFNPHVIITNSMSQSAFNDRVEPPNQKPPAIRSQFYLRTVFVVLANVSIFLACMRFGFSAVIAVGIPIAALATELLTTARIHGRLHGEPSRPVGIASLIWPLIVLLLSGFIILKHGRPYNDEAWLMLGASVCWTLFLIVQFRGLYRILLNLIPICLLVALLIPTPLIAHKYLVDSRMARRGVQIWIAIFAFEGRNTKTIEAYLGHLPPRWVWIDTHGGTAAPNRGPDAFEDYYLLTLDLSPISSSSKARVCDLSEILTFLPSEDAKRKVVTCLSDPDNLLRSHQAMLLTYLYAFGYSTAHEDEKSKWWDQYGQYFYVEYDASRAIPVVRGWIGSLERKINELDIDKSQLKLRLLQIQLKAAKKQVHNPGKISVELERMRESTYDFVNAQKSAFWW